MDMQSPVFESGGDRFTADDDEDEDDLFGEDDLGFDDVDEDEDDDDADEDLDEDLDEEL